MFVFIYINYKLVNEQLQVTGCVHLLCSTFVLALF